MPRKAAFNAGDFDAAMKSTGVYSAAGNLFWCDLKWRPCKHVFTNLKAVKELANFHFGKGPAQFPWKIIVALPSKSMKANELPLGHLHRVSPEECEAALLITIAKRIQEGATQAELRQWRKVVLTCEVQFEALATSDEAYFRSVNIRRSIIVANESLVRLALQQIQEILEFKQRKELTLAKTLDAGTLHQMWNDSVIAISSAYTDEISVSWIEAGMRVQKKILGDKDLRAVVVWMDAVAKNCFCESVVLFHIYIYDV